MSQEAQSQFKQFFISLVIIAILGFVIYAAYGLYKNSSLQNSQQSVTFKYPEKLVDNYMSASDWPPKIQIVNEKYTCIEAGLETGRAGRTSRVTVSGREYCVTKISEGAAGSMYTQYAYAFPFNNKTAIFTFTMRFPQCLNYDDPKKTECQNAQASFDINRLVDLMAGTLMGR